MDRNKRIDEIANKLYTQYISNGWGNVSLMDCEFKAISYIDTGDMLKEIDLNNAKSTACLYCGINPLKDTCKNPKKCSSKKKINS